MLRNMSLSQSDDFIANNSINNNCENRVKPMMLSGVKTEALLVFARTALERFFDHIDKNNFEPIVGSEADTTYVYETLKKLKDSLQKSVVNADYLISVVQGAKTDAALKELLKHEEPLMNYYDAMAHTVASHFQDKPAYIPEFLVICVLSYWIIEEEKSIELYPFLKEIDFELLIDKYESSRNNFKKDDKCLITDIFFISEKIVKNLKNKKYKINKQRVSKTRKKK